MLTKAATSRAGGRRSRDWARFVLLSITGQGLIMVSFWVAGRVLPVEAFGRFMANWVLITQVAVVANFGLDTWLLRQAAREEPGQALGQALATKAVGWVVLLPLAILGVPALQPQAYSRLLLGLAGAAAFAMGLGTSVVATLLGQMRILAAGLLRSGTGAAMAAAALILYLRGGGTEAAFMAARVGGAALALAAAGAPLRHGSFRPHLPRRLVWREGLPFVASDVFAQVHISADVVLLGLLASERVVGIYAPASVIVNGLFFVPNAIYSLLIPRFARLQQREEAGLSREVGLASASMSVLGIALALPLFLGRYLLIEGIYGVRYAESAAVLGLLAGLLVPKCLSFALAAYLTASGRQSVRSRAQGVTAAVNIGLNLWLIPALGWKGPILAYWTSEALLVCVYAMATVRGVFQDSLTPGLIDDASESSDHQLP